ncbi:mechanosensitive ion channel family protein [Flavobacterium capsici]|uniref:Mechanosensitive ion channel n=1 Tax=Flavobacterium capsici TaxID=3075618 RepID=A0AA96ETI1_9FLAO|nr:MULTISPECIES: mechanosensitive ion channel domain-containing protein [unclassified Flavobacterium]WNM18153.1 mechanosensitive ion channel [Flavobacterium sp. PMR2A8]WNM22205.1 mechanosensitive ion channel [Flavobacterium sp. PMTSA4]
MHKLIEKIFGFIPSLFERNDLNDTLTIYLSLLLNVLILCIISYLIFFISRKVLISLMTIIAGRTKTKFDDFLITNKTAKFIAYLIPFLFIYKSVPVILDDFVYWENIFNKLVRIYIVILSLWIVRSVLKALRDYLKQKPKFSDKPIDSYIQVIMIVLWLFGIVVIIFKIFDIGKATLFGTLGAVSAVIILVFRDTILGFVASVQVSMNDMVRIGDWVTFDKFGADGDVIEINLATVKVRNFDNTTTTIPTYSLISDSFKNWRGMQNSDGRRIKRYILIKSKSIRFLDEKELEKFKKIQLISNYIDTRQVEIQKFNTSNNIDKSLAVNGRNMTNFGLFRKYITEYLHIHPGLNKDMLLMCRQLQPTSQGIPLEIYTFSSDKRWVNYEHIMADIFDHIIASTPFFDLEIFELPTDSFVVDDKLVD